MSTYHLLGALAANKTEEGLHELTFYGQDRQQASEQINRATSDCGFTLEMSGMLRGKEQESSSRSDGQGGSP